MASSSDLHTPLVPVPLEIVEAELEAEEQAITALRRREFHSDTQVMSPQDSVIRSVSFRTSSEPTPVKSRTHQIELEADAPVAPRAVPRLASPELEREEKWAQRISYQTIVPVMRKASA